MSGRRLRWLPPTRRSTLGGARAHAAESAALAPCSVCLASFRIIGQPEARWWRELLRGGCEWKEAQPGNEAAQRQQRQQWHRWQATRQPTGTGTQAANAAQEVAQPCAGRCIHAARGELQRQLGNIGGRCHVEHGHRRLVAADDARAAAGHRCATSPHAMSSLDAPARAPLHACTPCRRRRWCMVASPSTSST